MTTEGTETMTSTTLTISLDGERRDRLVAALDAAAAEHADTVTVGDLRCLASFVKEASGDDVLRFVV